MTLFCNSFEVLLKKWMVNEGRGSRVKCRETSLEGERFVKVPLDSPCMTVIKMEQKANQKEVGMEWETK